MVGRGFKLRQRMTLGCHVIKKNQVELNVPFMMGFPQPCGMVGSLVQTSVASYGNHWSWDATPSKIVSRSLMCLSWWGSHCLSERWIFCFNLWQYLLATLGPGLPPFQKSPWVKWAIHDGVAIALGKGGSWVQTSVARQCNHLSKSSTPSKILSLNWVCLSWQGCNYVGEMVGWGFKLW